MSYTRFHSVWKSYRSLSQGNERCYELEPRPRFAHLEVQCLPDFDDRQESKKVRRITVVAFIF
jgi:hypothetical protein